MKPRIAIPYAHSQNAEYSNRVMPQYADAVVLAGGEAVPVPLDADNATIARIATQCDGVLLPGSRADVNPEKYGAVRDSRTAAADPQRDNVDELLLQDAYNMRKPVLGICFGVQILNVWRTGTLIQHIESSVQHNGPDAPEHAVTVTANSLLAKSIGASGRICVNSSHHQAIETPGDGLRIVARCEDDGVIEAVEGTTPNHFVLGVQWHPERMTDEYSRALFRSFVQAARAWHERTRPDFETLSR